MVYMVTFPLLIIVTYFTSFHFSPVFKKYLMKDCDFGERGGPALAFILKRNPHSTQWGDMYLYLEPQVGSQSFVYTGFFTGGGGRGEL